MAQNFMFYARKRLISHCHTLQGGWAAPGALSAAPVHAPLPTCSPANPLGSAATSAPMALSSNALVPLVYWYGHAATKRNPLLMDRLIRNMGENVNDKFELDAEGVTFLAPPSRYHGSTLQYICRPDFRTDHRHPIFICIGTRCQ